MNYLYTFLFCLFGMSLFAQNENPVAAQITDYHQKNAEFGQYQLFTRTTNPSISGEYQDVATDAVVLNLNLTELARLVQEKPQTLEITFPHKDGTITIELFKKNILTNGFYAVDQEKNELRYEPGVYYRGIVKNDPLSIAAFSFFENEVIGVASKLGVGNVVLGKIKGTSHYISYTANTLTGENPFRCGFDALPENQQPKVTYEENMANKPMTNNCVRIYYEIAYQPYLNNGSDVTATLNWITAIHNNISTLYANDNIQVSLSSTLVWTSEDPYIYEYSENLGYFSNFRTAFDGDLGHLVNSPSTTSVAYLNSLCQSNRYAYSGISQYFQDVPAYSWTVMAMTHEMGHSLGSPHTHACAWNGNNTAIDGCGPEAGYDEGCDAPLPTNGGTIMSYCHLVSSVGINLANGFGPQPSTLIQNNVDSKPCLGMDCITSCAFTVSDVVFTNLTTNSATVNIIDNISSNWDYKIYPFGGFSFNWITTNSNTFNVSGLSPNSYYILEVQNNCAAGSLGISLKKLLLTDGDYCNGVGFVDTGGQTGNYGDDQTLIKTFYPDGNGYVTLTFTEFDLEQDYDFMSIYDGENAETLTVFPNGNNLSGNTIPGPFVATNPAGAITVKFTSDTYLNFGGWEANISCTLGTANFTLANLRIYPNPSSSLVNIEAKTTLSGIEVYSLTGKLVKEKAVNASKASLQMGGLAKGTYFIRVFSGNHSQTFKVIRE